MSWGALLVLAAGAYAFKALGLIALRGRKPSARTSSALALLPAALLAALVVVQTFADARGLTLDARAAGLAAAGLAVWRGAPFLLVVFLGAGTAAGLRALV